MGHKIFFTFPKMVCLLLSSSARPRVKKNWLPLSWGPAFAIATKPLRLKRNLEWNSSCIEQNQTVKNNNLYNHAFLHILIHMSTAHPLNLVNNKSKSNLERATIDGLPTHPSACRITSLNNEFWHHTMKDCAIIVTCKTEVNVYDE